jgi:hypothetical protein
MCKFLSEITLPYNGNVVGMLLISFQIDISYVKAGLDVF